ncbi:hypothetical protein [Streptomyces lutosisoli]|uniref:ABC transmembrane type-1 domain-containing protein n=1 Tax=Streptomyces lutosisoli TaxID=2665721 RepID=A0ABW2VZ45_9ACTN
MLASVLPGIRELRTPLATGYIYLLALFLIVGDQIPTKGEAHDPLKLLYDVVGWIGKPTALAAATFVAYLLGSVLQVRAAAVGRGFRRATSQRVLRPYRERLEELWERWTDTPARFVVWLDLEVDEAGAEVPTPSVITLKMYVRDRLGCDVSNRIIGLGIIVLLEDLQQLATRLYASSKDLYGDYDRLAAEADLKVNVGFSAILLSCVAAVRLEAWWALLCAPMVFLICRGLSAARQASGVLVQAIVTDIVTSPQFEAYAEIVAKEQSASPPTTKRARFFRSARRTFKGGENTTPPGAP